MALGALSLLNYGLQVTTLTQNLDFKASSGGPTLTAQIDLGFYSAQGLAQAIATAMVNADPVNNYTITVNRNVMGGTQTLMTIATSGTFLSLLFGSGPNISSSIGPIIGFNKTDYLGLTSYTGNQTIGTVLIPEFIGYNYLDDLNMGKVFGSVNVSASGLKEAVVFNIQQFIEVEYMYEPKANLPAWQAFWFWAIQQRPFDFMPQISNPNLAYQVTLETTEYEGQGMGFRMKEMLPNFPNLFQTGSLTFRIIAANQNFSVGG